MRLAAGSQLGVAVAILCQGVANSEDVAATAINVRLLAISPAFQHRQMYALAFASMARGMPPETVLQHFWPAFACLAADGVSNVRLAVARTLHDLMSSQTGDEITDANVQSSENVAVFVAQPPILEVAVQMEHDIDQEVARLARRVVFLTGSLQP